MCALLSERWKWQCIGSRVKTGSRAHDCHAQPADSSSIDICRNSISIDKLVHCFVSIRNRSTKNYSNRLENRISTHKMPTYELAMLIRQLSRVSSGHFHFRSIYTRTSLNITSSIILSISARTGCYIETNRRSDIRARWHHPQIGQFGLSYIGVQN